MIIAYNLSEMKDLLCSIPLNFMTVCKGTCCLHTISAAVINYLRLLLSQEKTPRRKRPALKRVSLLHHNLEEDILGTAHARGQITQQVARLEGMQGMVWQFENNPISLE